MTWSVWLAAVVLVAPLVAEAAPAPNPSDDLRPLALRVPGDVVEDAHVVPASHATSLPWDEGIGPGSQLWTYVETEDAWFICTANFLWMDGEDLHLGTAGHCALPTGANATHGPNADYDASGGRVLVCVASCVGGGFTGSASEWTGASTWVELGDVVYARQKQEDDPQADDPGRAIGADFGLVDVPEELRPLVRADMPRWGGPTQTADDVSEGDIVLLYGNGIIVAETFLTKGRAGVARSFGDGWPIHEMDPALHKGAWYAVAPGAPGDSGSPLVVADAQGGVHGTLAGGIVTHGGGGQLFGTEVPRAVEMAEQAGLHVRPVLVDDAALVPDAP